MFRLRPAARSVAVIAIAAALVVIACAPAEGQGEPSTPAAAQPPGRLFTGDYSTGDFSQWPDISTKFWNDPAEGGLKTQRVIQPDYAASIVADPAKGHAARFEVRSGDGAHGKESSQVTATSAQTGGTEGQIRWYAFSTKFDPTFR